MQRPQSPFTPTSLLEYAEKCEAEYKQLSELHPPGTSHDGRNDARRDMEFALACAHWMESKGIKELAHVGPFVAEPLTGGRPHFRTLRDTKARIRAGATIRTLHPKSRGPGGLPGLITTERTRVVTVHDVHSGYVDTDSYNRRYVNSEAEAILASVHQPELVWAGTDGYWCYADVNDVEFLGKPEPKAETTKQRTAKP